MSLMPGVPSEAVSVLVVDDQAPFRTAARLVVRSTTGFEVVGEAKSGEEALDQVALLKPNLVLMDINMEGMGGIAATRHISEEYGGTEVILLSTYDEDDLPADARTCGALAYVHKERFGPDILEQAWATGHQNGNS
jgi:two-component system, NarL family, invasion response regulator UvrY